MLDLLGRRHQQLLQGLKEGIKALLLLTYTGKYVNIINMKSPDTLGSLQTEFQGLYGVDPSVLFNETMPSDILGGILKGRPLLDVYSDHLVAQLPETTHIRSGDGLWGGEIRQLVRETPASDDTRLLVRYVSKERLPQVNTMGTDRDHSSNLGEADMRWEQAAMVVNGLRPDDVAEVTYAGDLSDNTKYNPREQDALLVYYAGALKLIRPNRPFRRAHSNNFRMFLRPDLKVPSLLAVITKD